MEHSGSVLWSSDYTSGCIDTKINTKTASRNQNKISNHATFRWRERFNAVRRSVYKLDHSEPLCSGGVAMIESCCIIERVAAFWGVTAFWGVAATRYSCRMGDGLPPVDVPSIAEVMCIKDITVTHICDTQISQPWFTWSICRSLSLGKVVRLCYVMLRYAMVRYATVCYATLFYAFLCCICYVMLCHVMLWYAICVSIAIHL